MRDCWVNVNITVVGRFRYGASFSFFPSKVTWLALSSLGESRFGRSGSIQVTNNTLGIRSLDLQTSFIAPQCPLRPLLGVLLDVLSLLIADCRALAAENLPGP